jgi:ferric-dicitrate binding protein FerR (iron transport regulator)
MQEERKIEITLLKKFFNKECTTQEQEIVINWFVDEAYAQKLNNVLKKHWDELEYNSNELDAATERVLNKIHHQINLEKLDAEQNKSIFKKAVFYYSKIAAVLLIPVLLYTLYTSFGGEIVVIENQQMAKVEILSPLGARTHFTLPDGSSGWLNSGSTLEFPAKFTGAERNLKLIGEAWFDVVKNPDIPFVVNAQGVDVIALGTKFNVLAYPDSKSVDVTLESGIVVVKRKSGFTKKVIAELKPGDQVRISKEKKVIPTKDIKVETKNYTSWRQGRLVIRNEPMSDIAKRLERWYNVKITIQNKEIEEYLYRATFQDETIDEVLNYLKLTSPIEYKIKKRVANSDEALVQKEIEIYLIK